MASGIVCVFVKEPRPGHVKTRLARRVGAERAARLSSAFLLDTLAQVRRLPCRLVVAVSPDDYRPARDLACWPQGQGDLGDRMERAARQGLSIAPWILIVGTDAPGLPEPILETAVERLGRGDGPDAVIGPCDDGGYYALGLRRPCGLRGIRWSSAQARTDTEQALERAGLTCEHLPFWFDVDDHPSLLRVERLIAEGAIRAPHTERALAEGASRGAQRGLG